MRNTLYYGEIADTITAHLYKNPNHFLQIDRCIGGDDPNDTVWTVISEAAYIFENIQDLADEIEISQAMVKDYSNEVLDHLLVGQKPSALTMIDMAARSIQTSVH